jgi:hypothetical protein
MNSSDELRDLSPPLAETLSAAKAYDATLSLRTNWVVLGSIAATAIGGLTAFLPDWLSPHVGGPWRGDRIALALAVVGGVLTVGVLYLQLRLQALEGRALALQARSMALSKQIELDVLATKARLAEQIAAQDDLTSAEDRAAALALQEKLASVEAHHVAVHQRVSDELSAVILEIRAALPSRRRLLVRRPDIHAN